MDPSDPPITEVASGEACHYQRSLRLGPQSHFQICLSGYQKLGAPIMFLEEELWALVATSAKCFRGGTTCSWISSMQNTDQIL